MKITESQLRAIIKQELKKTLNINEGFAGEESVYVKNGTLMGEFGPIDLQEEDDVGQLQSAIDYIGNLVRRGKGEKAKQHKLIGPVIEYIKNNSDKIKAAIRSNTSPEERNIVSKSLADVDRISSL